MADRLVPPNLPLDDACRLMLRLRQAPELFERIAQFEGAELALQKALREDYDGELVAAAISLTELRHKAREKFAASEQMWFDRRGLEQATAEPVARHKAQRFFGEVDDLCCGIGADAIALARRATVRAIDLSPAACLRTWWNAEASGCQQQIEVVCDDAVSFRDGPRLVHIDPDRRARSSKKVVRIEDSEPGLPFLRELIAARPGGAIKLSPAANFTGKFPDAEIELVSLHGECKEATIWFGSLGEHGLWRATALPSGETLAGNPLDAWSEVAPPSKYIYDPDPAVVRAGLVDLLASDLQLQRLDDAEEYLTAERPVESPFLRGFELLDVLPYSDKVLRRYFRESSFGWLEIKCRHVPVPIESLRKKLTLPGDQPGVLIVARLSGKTHALICRRLDD